MDLSLYDYPLPEAQIARRPASPRDSSKLLIYDTRTNTITVDSFRNLHKHIPAESLLVMNETKVLPCRVQAESSKGPVELLIMTNEWNPTDTVLNATCSKKLHPGEIVKLGKTHRLTVLESNEKVFRFKPSFSLKNLPAILARIGHVPIPNYITNCELTEAEKRKKYQSILAKDPGSVAAPTASLHFTPRVLKSLRAKGVDLATLTLHIGLGTFAPVLPEHFDTGTLYKERYWIPQSTQEKIAAQKKAHKPLIAVGTTATRALESFARSSAPEGPTELFIFPPYQFQVLDGLLTNFHLPKSSLMMLVESFLQHKNAQRHLTELYTFALANDFRFYSFGDGMLIL